MSLYKRIQELASARNISIAELERKLGFANGSMRKWDKHPPGISKLESVADYFDVSTDSLLGRNRPSSISVPSWASKEDVVDLEKLLDSGVSMAFNGEDFSEEDAQRIKGIIETIYWEKRSKKRNKNN